jgi:vacuolar-type H+-ATPase subunit H
MEELRSTEALDREILEDARKKADRILKTADQTVHSIQEQWNEKLRADLAVLEQVYHDRTKKTEEEIMARLPLDKHRLRSERAERILQQAASDFCASLPRNRVLSVLRQELASKYTMVSEMNGFHDTDKGIAVSVHGLLKEESEQLFAAVLPHATILYRSDCTWSDKILYPEIICETADLRMVVSFKAVIDQLLLDKRSELAVALLGKGVTND